MHRLAVQNLVLTCALCALCALCSLLGACTENACAECQREKCADLLGLCEQDQDCACMGDCVASGGIPAVDSCLSECEIEQRPAGFVALEECMAVACPDSDECDTPSGYAPPEQLSSDAAPPPAAADIASGDFSDCDFLVERDFDPDGEVLQLLSADGEVCVRLERRNEGAGSLANTRWTLLSMYVGPEHGVSRIDREADLCWYSSHHNFNDWAHGWSGDRHYDVELAEDGHGGPRSYRLHVFEQAPLGSGPCAPTSDGGDPIGGPIELLPVNP